MKEYDEKMVKNILARADEKEKKKKLTRAKRRREIVEVAFGNADEAMAVVECPEQTMYLLALDEIKDRLSPLKVKGMSDRDLITITKLLHDIIEDKKSEDGPKVQNNTQNIINVFSEAIEQSIKDKYE